MVIFRAGVHSPQPMPQLTPPPRTHHQPPVWAGLALGVVILSASTRLCNLGTFSLWLDEILMVERARGTVAAAWRASAANAEHPPFTAVLMSMGYGAGLGDTAQRLLPIIAGILTVLLLAAWVARHLGRRAGIIAGVLAALSPLHVRYSQELRPYSYLLLFVMLTLVTIDRLRRGPTGETRCSSHSSPVPGSTPICSTRSSSSRPESCWCARARGPLKGLTRPATPPSAGPEQRSPSRSSPTSPGCECCPRSHIVRPPEER